MRKFKVLILFLCVSFFTQTLLSQVYVDEEGNVGVAIEVPINSKTQIQNDDQNTTLHLENHSEIGVGLHKWGIWNIVNENGLGFKRGIYNKVIQNTASASATNAILNYSEANGTGSTTGFLNDVKFGTGGKTGISNNVTQTTGSSEITQGIFNNVLAPSGSTGEYYGSRSIFESNTSAKNYGNFMEYYYNGTGHCYANYTKIWDTPLVTTKGFFNSYSYTTHSNNGHHGYGNYNYVHSTSTNALKNSYGVLGIVKGTGNATRIGVYGYALPTKGYAGYFVGNVHVSGNVANYSDESLKDNIRSLNGAIALISQLSPKTYKYKENPNLGLSSERMQFGFIAQELEKVIPELVDDTRHPGLADVISSTKSEVREIIDSDGNVVEYEVVAGEDIIEETENTILKSINYTGMIAILTQAIKEQQIQIEDIGRMMEGMKKENEALRKAIESKGN